MVNPLYIMIIALAAAFLLPLLEKAGRAAIAVLMLVALGAIAAIGIQWFAALAGGGQETMVFTAGFRPPFSINLRMGLEEAMLSAAIGLTGVAGAVYLIRDLSRHGARSMMLYILMVMGLNGMVLTRDLFNLFVFIEITGIAGYALVAMKQDVEALAASLKYALAGAVASIFMLLGIILIYSQTGSLNIDGIMAVRGSSAATVITAPAIFMLVFAFMIETKQFPANGWAIDIYDRADAGVAALISAAGSGAALFALYKVLPIGGAEWYRAAAIAGMATFLASNLIALRQERAGRLLGYSSTGQMGLLLSVVALGLRGDLGQAFPMIAGGLFLNHLLAKAGLFWLTGLVGTDRIRRYGRISGKVLILFLFGIFIAALAGFPPFPGFWAKWALVRQLAPSGGLVWVISILLGSLLEVVYLYRWFGWAVKGENEDPVAQAKAGTEDRVPEKSGVEKEIAMSAFAIVLALAGYYMAGRLLAGPVLFMLPLVASAGMLLFERFHPRVRAVVAMGNLVYFAIRVMPHATGIPLFFTLLFISGGLLVLIASLHRDSGSKGFYPLIVLLTGSLAVLAISKTPLQFFFSWELMTLSSYLLVLNGRKALRPALTYMIFSAASAYLVMIAFAILGNSLFGAGHILPAVAEGPVSVWAFILLALGFLIKVAGIGLHTWAPGAYSEAEDDMSAMMSGVLSKAGVLGFIFLFIRAGSSFEGAKWVYYTLGWFGAATAFFGALYASMQEDAKKLLAWSSVGQVGYIILAVSAMSHLGWVTALYHSVNHLLFKVLLFLAVAGVIHRTGTRKMYEMGGLIKRMPLSFISVIIGIIALSGVPPLTGFGGKWLLYNTLIEKGWYLQAAFGFFSSTVAFLYCFRLIHSIFLGQAKPAFKEVREASYAFIIPQYLLIMAIMALSVFPGLLLKPVSSVVADIFTSTISWEGGTLRSSVGYWNGTTVMMTVGFIFAIVLVILLIKSPRPQKVGQFNIVFASERPDRPETTHYAWKFFSPYERALGGLLKPRAERFWRAAGEWTGAVASLLRHIYSGSTTAYMVHIFLLGIVLFLLSRGGGS